MQVYVAIYSHEYGNDVRVFRNSESADKWRIELANNWWGDMFGEEYEKPEDKEKMAQMYWDAVNGEEWFEINVCNVEG